MERSLITYNAGLVIHHEKDELLNLINAAYDKITAKENRVPHFIELHDFLLEEFHDYNYSIVRYNGGTFPVNYMLNVLEEVLNLEKIEFIDNQYMRRNNSQQLLLENLYSVVEAR